MVEMLGVLAIIGVLSIGGIAGYTRAMKTWRANEIIDAANKAVVLAETEEGSGATITYSTYFTISNIAGGSVNEITAVRTGSTGTITIDLKANGSAMKDLADAITEKIGTTSNPRILGGYTPSVTCNGATCAST